MDEWVSGNTIQVSLYEPEDETEIVGRQRSSESSDNPSFLVIGKGNVLKQEMWRGSVTWECGRTQLNHWWIEKEHEELTIIKYIYSIQLGIHEVSTGYFRSLSRWIWQAENVVHFWILH